jgi:hypothetical protein
VPISRHSHGSWFLTSLAKGTFNLLLTRQVCFLVLNCFIAIYMICIQYYDRLIFFLKQNSLLIIQMYVLYNLKVCSKCICFFKLEKMEIFDFIINIFTYFIHLLVINLFGSFFSVILYLSLLRSMKQKLVINGDDWIYCYLIWIQFYMSSVWCIIGLPGAKLFEVDKATLLKRNKIILIQVSSPYLFIIF